MEQTVDGWRLHLSQLAWTICFVPSYPVHWLILIWSHNDVANNWTGQQLQAFRSSGSGRSVRKATEEIYLVTDTFKELFLPILQTIRDIAMYPNDSNSSSAALSVSFFLSDMMGHIRFECWHPRRGLNASSLRLPLVRSFSCGLFPFLLSFSSAKMLATLARSFSICPPSHCAFHFSSEVANKYSSL